MDIDRRKFLAMSAATSQPAAAPPVPWHQRLRRVGQINMNERDPIELDVSAWADYWAGVKVDAVLVSVTGILAFYPTEVPFHRRSRFLGNRDLFGDCAKAARQRGIHVIARMSPDLQWKEAAGAHPEWFTRDRAGNLVPQIEAPGLYRTCMFSPYFTEQIPAIMREINARYEVDGLFTNAWPPGGLPVCFCQNCKGLPDAGTPEYREKFMDRVLMLWRLYDGIAKEKNKENLYFGNLGGGITPAFDLKRLGAECYWFNADNQGRGAAGSAWGATQQGRVAQSVMNGRTITNVTGAWSTGTPRWRNTAKSPAEATMWMAQTVASGMVVWYHWVGGQNGMGADRRWLETGRKFLQWHARHERHFVNKRSIANTGVVLSQRTHAFYNSPGGISDFMQGLYYTLLEGRVLFDLVHEDDLTPDRLRKYKALILPNVALLSDAQCRQLQAYADSGGSLLATFETSLFDERGKARADFGLAGLFGVHKNGDRQGPNGNGSYARIERPHEILRGFEGTSLLPGPHWRVPVKAPGQPVLSAIPSYTAYPPELSYAPSGPDGPAVVLTEKGAGRVVYFPGDIDRTAWVSGNTDVSALLLNAVRWVLRGDAPVSIAGEGLVEAFAWETEPGFAVHVLNYNNPNLHRGWIRQFYPIGPQQVRMAVPGGRRITRVELLRAETEVRFTQNSGVVEFTIPKVVDYEVAALY